MADLFTVTAPLAMRLPNGEMHSIAECYKHPKGLLVFWPFWHLQKPEEGIQLIKGWISGEGPWKIDGYVINVLGCHGTNAELASAYQQWQTYLQTSADDYPPPSLVTAIARRLGAITEPPD